MKNLNFLYFFSPESKLKLHRNQIQVETLTIKVHRSRPILINLLNDPIQFVVLQVGVQFVEDLLQRRGGDKTVAWKSRISFLLERLESVIPVLGAAFFHFQNG